MHVQDHVQSCLRDMMSLSLSLFLIKLPFYLFFAILLHACQCHSFLFPLYLPSEPATFLALPHEMNFKKKNFIMKALV